MRPLTRCIPLTLYIWSKLEMHNTQPFRPYHSFSISDYLLILLSMERQVKKLLTCHIHRNYLEPLTSLIISFHSPRRRSSYHPGNSFWRITSGTILTSCRFRGMNVIFAPFVLLAHSCDIAIPAHLEYSLRALIST